MSAGAKWNSGREMRGTEMFSIGIMTGRWETRRSNALFKFLDKDSSSPFGAAANWAARMTESSSSNSMADTSSALCRSDKGGSGDSSMAAGHDSEARMAGISRSRERRVPMGDTPSAGRERKMESRRLCAPVWMSMDWVRRMVCGEVMVLACRRRRTGMDIDHGPHVGGGACGAVSRAMSWRATTPFEATARESSHLFNPFRTRTAVPSGRAVSRPNCPAVPFPPAAIFDSL